MIELLQDMLKYARRHDIPAEKWVIHPLIFNAIQVENSTHHWSFLDYGPALPHLLGLPITTNKSVVGIRLSA